MLDLGTIGAAIKLDDGQWINKLKNTENQTFTMIKKIAGMAAMYLSARKIFGFIYDSVNLYSDLQETTSKFDVVFGSVANKAKAAAGELKNLYGQSESSAKQMMGDTGDLLTGFGFDPKQALELSTRVAKLGVDLASFSNYSGGAKGASYALTKAMVGETEMAKMLGIVIKTDSEEYKKLIKTLIKTKGLTETQAKAYAALEIATKQSTNAIGDYARTQDEIANQQRLSAIRWKEIKEAAGEFVSELFNVKQGYKDVNEIMNEVSGTIKTNSAEWVFSAKTVWYEIETGIKTIWAFIEPLASFIGKSFINGILNIGTAFQYPMQMAEWFFKNSGTLSANFLDIIIALGKDIIHATNLVPNIIMDTGIQLSKELFSLFAKVGKNIWKVLSGKMSFKDAMADSVDGVGENFKKAFDKIVDNGIKSFGDLGRNTDEILKKIGTTPMPELKFQAADPMEIINKYKDIGNTLDGIWLEKRKKQNALEEAFAKKMDKKNEQSKNKKTSDAGGNGLSTKLDAVGSFNAAILEIMGGGSNSPAERTAKATEKQVKVLKKVEKNTKDGGTKQAYT